MGEVYLGLQEGLGGLERLVVVKRIYPHFGDDEHFTRLLLEEARLAASIRHPNVVQILDIGRDSDGYFLVMEYLSGETLVYVSRTMRERGERVPPAIACGAAAEFAAGLHCAHTATDAAGLPQPIVHRDVTPSNLILCFNGAVKIVDFGVAKANQTEGRTGGGLKGKMSYLAPEQLHEKPVDGRSDVFQLGICLHELLTGQRLFRGDDDRQRALAVLEREIPAPSSIVPSLPPALDDVVLWALERDPDQRPASAEEFGGALESAMAESGIGGRHEIGAWMKTTFAERMAARTSFERLCVDEMRVGRSGDGLVDRRTSGTVVFTPPDSDAIDLHFEYDPPSQDSGSAAPSPDVMDGTGWEPAPARSRSWIVVGLATLTLLLIAGSLMAWNVEREPDEARAEPAPAPAPVARPRPAPVTTSPRSFDVAIAASPADAIIEIDGIEVGRGSYRITLPMDGARHVMTVRAGGFEAAELEFTDEPPPARIELTPVLVPAPAPRERRAQRPPRRPQRRAPARRVDDRASPTDNPDPWQDDRRGAR
jgi:eukaryotic-like serine/threonine-protein kinase